MLAFTASFFDHEIVRNALVEFVVDPAIDIKTKDEFHQFEMELPGGLSLLSCLHERTFHSNQLAQFDMNHRSMEYYRLQRVHKDKDGKDKPAPVESCFSTDKATSFDGGYNMAFFFYALRK